jgi:hypothetical protein
MAVMFYDSSGVDNAMFIIVALALITALDITTVPSSMTA